MEMEKLGKRREEKWLCFKCVKNIKSPKGKYDLRCNVFIAGAELGKTGKCWAFSDDPDFYIKLVKSVKKYKGEKINEKISENRSLKFLGSK